MNAQKESLMKTRGVEKVWKTITSKSGSPKSVSQIQLGQQLIFTEALRLEPILRNWIDNESANVYRKALQESFEGEDTLLKKTTATMLLLAASSHVIRTDEKRILSRHKSISTIQKHVFEKLSFENTWRFVEVLVDESEHFVLTRKPNGKMESVFYTCLLSETIAQKLAQEAHAAFFPEPMTKPPLDWKFQNNVLSGGYASHQYDLIRMGTGTPDYNKYSQKIFDDANYIQSTPWRVNKDLLRVVSENLRHPEKSTFIKSEYPDDTECRFDIKLDKDAPKSLLPKADIEKIVAARIVFTDCMELYNAERRDYESAVGKFRAIKLALGIAERYADCDEIYFPHSYDFRGRIYPLPVGLSPQGSDAVKAILEYKEGEKLSPRGEKWAWAYLASLFGDDKIDFEERVVRGKELIDADYSEADEPYQFLAHQIELKKFLADENYLFKGRIHLDACNSGLI